MAKLWRSLSLGRARMGIFSLFKPSVEKMERKKDVKGLIKALKDEDWAVRCDAAKVLGRLGDARAVEPLIQALKDQEWAVRRSTAEALGKIGDGTAVEPLIQALRDEEELVQGDAAEALAKIGDGKTIERLIQVRKDEPLSVRLKAERALYRLGWEPPDVKGKVGYLIGVGDWGSTKHQDELVKCGSAAVKPLIQELKHGIIKLYSLSNRATS